MARPLRIELCGGGITSRLAVIDGRIYISLALEHVEITSTGKTRLTATGDISLDPGVNYSYQHWTTKHSSGGWFSKKTTITEHVRESSTVAPSQIKAGEIEVLSGGAKMPGSGLAIQQSVTITGAPRIPPPSTVNPKIRPFFKLTVEVA